MITHKQAMQQLKSVNLDVPGGNVALLEKLENIYQQNYSAVVEEVDNYEEEEDVDEYEEEEDVDEYEDEDVDEYEDEEDVDEYEDEEDVDEYEE